MRFCANSFGRFVHFAVADAVLTCTQHTSTTDFSKVEVASRARTASYIGRYL